MSFYFLTFVLLAAGALLEWFRPQYEEKIYWLCWGVMTACLCFRFGQGVDYITYHAIYETIPTVIDLSQGYICGFYPEIGWRLLCALFKVFHAPFWVLTMTVGLAEMLLVHRFLKKYVPMKVAGLFLLYPVLFVTYMVSGLRQGFAMCLFLGVLLPFYLEKKWVSYVIGVIVASSFHNVGYAWLVLVIAYYLPIWMMGILTGLSVAVGVIIQIEVVQQFIVNLIPVYHMKQFLLENEISIFAVGERLISFGVLFLLYLWIKKKQRLVEHQTELLLKAYMCGVCFYMLMFGNAYYASRYAIIFKILECAVVLVLIKDRDFAAKGVCSFFAVLTLVMGCKNLNAMADTCGYSEFGKNFLTTPYISIFNQDAVLEYISYEDRLWEIYGYNIEDQQLWMIEE
ncbi:MAG: EpsG family protein [Lachnospiraceae bacterium]|nr:EpsG family protein [Lachnospiraceae bacterium]